MARPTKQGIDYFPLDCQFNSKFQLYKIDTGAPGLAVWVTILQMAYSNEGCYVDDANDLHLLIKREINVELAEIKTCIGKCLDRGIFDNRLHETCGILTSAGIQQRYFIAAKQKKRVNVNQVYLLVPTSSFENLVYSDGNSVSEAGYDTKVEENIKEEEEKRICSQKGEIQAAPSPANQNVPFEEIQSLWNEFAEIHGLPKSTKLTQKLKSQIRQRWMDDLQAIHKWKNYFDFISCSRFLTGKSSVANGRTDPFRASLGWITLEENFAKIADETYHDGPI